MITSWFAADSEGRVAVFEIGEFGARPERALRLDAIDGALLGDWWSEDDDTGLLRFAHVASSPGGLYERVGGAGTVSLTDLPEALREPVAAVSLPVDLTRTDVVDLVKLIPEELLLGQETEPPEAESPIEFKELFGYIGPRIRMTRDGKEPGSDDEDGGAES